MPNSTSLEMSAYNFVLILVIYILGQSSKEIITIIGKHISRSRVDQRYCEGMNWSLGGHYYTLNVTETFMIY